jgi:hypothetical protein
VYAALWRLLPGPWWVRLLIALVLVAALLVVLDEWVFPWAQSLVLDRDVTVGS